MLKSIGLWLLKIILGGIYGRTMAKVEAAAESKKQAAILHAETTTEAATTEVKIEKAKQTVKEKYENKPKDEKDPFGNDDWNGNGAT